MAELVPASLSLVAWHGRDVTESGEQTDGGTEGCRQRRRRRTNALFWGRRMEYCEGDR